MQGLGTLMHLKFEPRARSPRAGASGTALAMGRDTGRMRSQRLSIIYRLAAEVIRHRGAIVPRAAVAMH
jgi:hypothetical protein